jgi:hypothetical protein
MFHSRLKPINNAPTLTPNPDFQKPEETEEDTDDSPEDILSTFLPHLLPDDAPSFHGDPGQTLLYTSPRYGDLNIMVPSYPDSSNTTSVDAGRKLFAHFLWSAGMVVAEGIEVADGSRSKGDIWVVEGERVLELGAGVYYFFYLTTTA